MPQNVTNTNGECTWLGDADCTRCYLRGPLDTVSALAVAEGGLRGFGVTVGDSPITYHFTFHGDGRVSTSMLPGSGCTISDHPVGETLHGGAAPTPVPTSEQRIDVTPTRLPEQAGAETRCNPASSSPLAFPAVYRRGSRDWRRLTLWWSSKSGSQPKIVNRRTLMLDPGRYFAGSDLLPAIHLACDIVGYQSATLSIAVIAEHQQLGDGQRRLLWWNCWLMLCRRRWAACSSWP